MTSRRIIVICKYNQARSITAAAALRRFFPELEIITAGILANPSIPIPTSIVEILSQWGLDQYDHRSTPVVSLANVSPLDFIICADEEVKVTVIKQLGITKPADYSIISLEEFARTPQEIPTDPVAMSQPDTKTQLARAIILSIRAVRAYLQIEPVVTESTIPMTTSDHLQSQQKYLHLIEKGDGVIIDTGFSIPNPLLWQAHKSPFISFNPKKPPLDPSELKKSGIYISKYEVDHASRILLSSEYLQWLELLHQNKAIYTISQPISELPSSHHHQAILGSIHS